MLKKIFGCLKLFGVIFSQIYYCVALHKLYVWKMYLLFFLNFFFIMTSIIVFHLALGLNSITTVQTLLWRRNKQKLADTIPDCVQKILGIFLLFKSVKILPKSFKNIHEKYCFSDFQKKYFIGILHHFFLFRWKKAS